MTKIILTAAAALLLSSCAVIPGTESNLADTRRATPVILESPQPPQAAAKCVVNAVDDKLGSMTPLLLDGPTPGTYEVRIRSQAGVASVMSFEPHGDGSRITARISNHYPFQSILLKKMTGGC
jgi:hypothetical protein